METNKADIYTQSGFISQLVALLFNVRGTNVFPILKEFVINRMGLIGVNAQQQYQSKKRKLPKVKYQFQKD